MDLEVDFHVSPCSTALGSIAASTALCPSFFLILGEPFYEIALIPNTKFDLLIILTTWFIKFSCNIAG